MRVPVSNVVGEENGGWQLITTQLNHERVGLAAHSGGAPTGSTTTSSTGAGDRRPAAATATKRMIDVPWVQLDLARCHALLEAMKLLNWSWPPRSPTTR